MYSVGFTFYFQVIIFVHVLPNCTLLCLIKGTGPSRSLSHGNKIFQYCHAHQQSSHFDLCSQNTLAYGNIKRIHNNIHQPFYALDNLGQQR